MANEKEQLEALTDIRNIMERSTRFLSLSGLSGVFAGVFALIGAGAAYLKIEENFWALDEGAHYHGRGRELSEFLFFFADAGLVLMASLTVGYFFTHRRAKKQGLKVWDGSSRRLAFSLFIPLLAGGIFCLELLNKGMISMIAPATLLFYGMALLNASKYTLTDIKYLGISEMILGLVAAARIGPGLLFWAIGFGFLHIIYGTAMWYKYERGGIKRG
ncbi:MAG: hypothetical protein ACHQRM_03015 [Bacteroidia bacterium]